MMSKLKSSGIFRASGNETCLQIQTLRHPVYRRRDLITGTCVECEDLSSRWKEKISSNSDRKKESINAWHGGRTSCSVCQAV